MDMDMANIGYLFSVWTIPVLLAVTLHEAAHGWVAWRLGDDTAKRLGRVTFNPIKHIDPFGTVLLPVALLFFSGGRMMFGFAKPVPVNFGRLRRPRRDMILVAAAGPATNLGLAVIAGLLGHGLAYLSGDLQAWAIENLQNALLINLFLCVFNMLPIPPLDGGRVAVGLLPAFLARPLAALERWGIMLILAAVFILPRIGGKMGVDLNVFKLLVADPALALRDIVLMVTGHY